MYGRHGGADTVNSVAVVEVVPLKNSNNNSLSVDDDEDLDDLEDEEEYLDEEIFDADYVVEQHRDNATGSLVPVTAATPPIRPVRRSVRAVISKAAAAPPPPAGGDKRKADESLDHVTPPKKPSKTVATKKKAEQATTSTVTLEKHTAHLKLADLQASNARLVEQLSQMNARMAQKDDEIAALAESERELARTQALERAGSHSGG